MSTTAYLVCLANSRKLRGRCIAGRLWDGKQYSKWIRPVSNYGKGELFTERLYDDGGDPTLLDIIKIPLGVSKPVGCHTEDHLIQTGVKWEKYGVATFSEIAAGAELALGPIWVNAGSTSEGENDSIPDSVAATLESSLKIIRPKRLEMVATSEGAYFGTPKRRVRGHFDFGRYRYVFSVTDAVVEAEFGSQAVGFARTVESPLLCLSVSEVFDKQSACYKLIAGVIEE